MIERTLDKTISPIPLIPKTIFLFVLLVFFAMAPSFPVWSQVPGSLWSEATASASFSPRFDHSSVVYNGKMWVVGGFNGATALGDVWSSPDGVNWTEFTAAAAFGPRVDFSMVVYNGFIWVIGGTTGTGGFNDVWYSSDGGTWT
jgi:hypothetical protein